MSEVDRDDEEDAKREPRYEPPAIVETAEFETLAMACGKSQPTFQCVANGLEES
jgi:hypothetical protein